MKYACFSFSLLLAAGLLSGIPAEAQTATSATIGDVFLGFHASGGTGADRDYLVNVGPSTQFENATQPFVLSLGNINADLKSVFGDSYATRSDLFVGFISSNTQPGTTVGPDPAATLFVSIASGSGIVPSRKSTNTQTTISNKIAGLTNYYITTNGTSNGTPQMPTANSTKGLIQNNTDTNSYSSFQLPLGSPSTNSFGFGFSNEAAYSDGTTSGPAFDFYRVIPISGAAQPSERIGTFTFGTNASITFMPVPEPSSLVVLGTSLAWLGCARFRSRNSLGTAAS